MSERFVVAGSKPWNRRVFDETISRLPGQWSFAADPAALEADLAGGPAAFVFFLHWSWIVPASIYDAQPCVNFHMADLPAGRGGSPLQNLVLAGHRHTKLNALQMTGELDAGPVYLARDLCLEGTAEQVYVRATELAASMIEELVSTRPEPVAQDGGTTVFRRRTPAESELPAAASLDDVYDFIRMLDAEGYPHAFAKAGRLRFEFRRAARYEGRVEADVTITVEGDG